MDIKLHSKLVSLSVIWFLEGENVNYSNKLRMSAYEKKFNTLPQKYWAETDAKRIFTQVTEFIMLEGEEMHLPGLKGIWLHSALLCQSTSLPICRFLSIINYLPSKLALTHRVIQYFCSLEHIYEVCAEASFQAIRQVYQQS